jgi:hypothetical protein
MAGPYYEERPLGPNGPIPVQEYRSERAQLDSARIAPYLVADVDAVQHSSVKWRAIFAGFFVSLMTYLILMSLGLAMGGGQLQTAIPTGDVSIPILGSGAGLWITAAVVVSLFIGSYASGRVSGLVTNRVGRTQGVVVSALFLGFLLSQFSLGIDAGAAVDGSGGDGLSRLLQARTLGESGGWTLFASLFLGLLSSILGGGIGARANLRAPLSRADRVALRSV